MSKKRKRIPFVLVPLAGEAADFQCMLGKIVSTANVKSSKLQEPFDDRLGGADVLGHDEKSSS